MARLGRVLGICGLAALLSVPLTLFLWDWRLTWVALAKGLFGLAAVAFWAVTNARGLRETFQGRSVFYGTFSAVFTGLLIFGLVVANTWAHLYPRQWDLTDEQLFSLAPQTIELVAGLEQPVEVLAFYGPGEQEHDLIRALLERYRAASASFHYQLLDPSVELALAERLHISRGGPRLVLRQGEREERVKPFDPEQHGPEEAITNALQRLVGRGANARVCFTTGHGERATRGEDPLRSMRLWARDLAAEGLRVEDLSLIESPRVPEDCTAVVVAGPQRDLAEAELASLEAYLTGGGRLMVLVGVGETTSLDGLLSRHGVQLGRDVVINPRSRSPLEVVSDPLRYPKVHPIFTRFFQGGQVLLNQLAAILPMARSVSHRERTSGLQVTELVYSSANAWAEVDPIEGVDQIAFDPDRDRAGPVPLGVAVERLDSGDRPGQPAEARRLVVFGSSAFVADGPYQAGPFNRNLAMNTFAWLIHQENQITIRPRLRAASLLRLDEGQLKFITFFASDILPLVILALGISIWQLRRFR